MRKRPSTARALGPLLGWFSRKWRRLSDHRTPAPVPWSLPPEAYREGFALIYSRIPVSNAELEQARPITAAKKSKEHRGVQPRRRKQPMKTKQTPASTRLRTTDGLERLLATKAETEREINATLEALYPLGSRCCYLRPNMTQRRYGKVSHAALYCGHPTVCIQPDHNPRIQRLAMRYVRAL